MNRYERITVRKQNPDVRIKNFEEVVLGYTEDEACAEAERCLQCKKAPCRQGCPVGVDIPAFVYLIKEKNYLAAAQKIREYNNLPAICGRVCPQENQCEKYCVLGKKGQPLAIGLLERFVADFEINHGGLKTQPVASKNKKVAIVGSGPAGLSAAGELARRGYQVVIFEALHEPGGVLAYGIPEFRLPKKILKAEIENLIKMGVEIITDFVVGKLKSIDELLKDGFSAVFLGTGAGLPKFMKLPGENLNRIYSANEFLTRVNFMKAYKFPLYDTPIVIGKKVAVIGGGNVAIDCARCAIRLGTDEVVVVYRRSEEEMPARREEIENAKEEGIKFLFLTAPLQFVGNTEGSVIAAECIRMQLGEPDSSGRRRPIPVEGSEFFLETDTIIVAIGQSPNLVAIEKTPDLLTRKNGTIFADPDTGKTSKERVFAGGDVVTGAATVISAMEAGKKAAIAIDKYLTNI